MNPSPSPPSQALSGSTTRFCLNCGTAVDGKFCPECGQSVATPERITRKNFWKTLTRNFIRITPGFFPTCWMLMTRPWVVIMDHLQGRRGRFTGPFTLFIQLTLVMTFIFTIETHFIDLHMENEFVENDIHWIFKIVLNSKFMRNLIGSLPIGWFLYLVYGKIGKYNINVYECFTATFYFFVSLQLYSFLLHYVRAFESMFLLIGFIPPLILGIIGIRKTFRKGSKAKRTFLLLTFLILSLASTLTIMFLMAYVARM